MSDSVDHPSYYGTKEDLYEVIKVCEAWLSREELIGALKFQIWKYTARAGKKTQDPTEDYRKALWYNNYLNDYLRRIKENSPSE